MSKTDYATNYDREAAIQSGLDSLLRFNRAMWISVDDDQIDKSLVEEYFIEEEGSDGEIRIEKQIGAAVICACYDNPDIPQEYKAKVAKKMQRQFLDSLRGAKVEYMYAIGRLGVPIRAERERVRRLKEIAIVRKAQFFDTCYKIINRKGQRTGVKFTIGTLIKALTGNEVISYVGAQVGQMASMFIPNKVKESIKSKANEICEKTVNSITNQVVHLQETPVGKKVTEIIENKVAPIIKRGVEVATRVGHTVKEKVRQGWTRIKCFFS